MCFGWIEKKKKKDKGNDGREEDRIIVGMILRNQGELEERFRVLGKEKRETIRVIEGSPYILLYVAGALRRLPGISITNILYTYTVHITTILRGYIQEQEQKERFRLCRGTARV